VRAIDHGTTPDGVPITDVMLDAMVEEAERGCDVDDVIRRRRGGRPAMGSAAASVDHVSVSETIRRAIGQYLHAS
jgi:hypothetical protein